MNERQTGAHEVKIGFVDLRRFVCEQTGLNLYARRAQVSKAFAGDFWIQVLDGRDDAFDPGGEQCVAARRGASVMRVRFE